MRKLLIAGLMVIGAALPVMARDIEQKDVDWVRRASRLSYAREMATNDEIREDLKLTCEFMQAHRSEEKLRELHIDLASRLDTHEQRRQYADYVLSVIAVSKIRLCPSFWD